MNHREEAERLLVLATNRDRLRMDPMEACAMATAALAHATLAGQRSPEQVRMALELYERRQSAPVDISEPVILFQGKDCGPKYTTSDQRLLTGMLDD